MDKEYKENTCKKVFKPLKTSGSSTKQLLNFRNHKITAL